VESELPGTAARAHRLERVSPQSPITNVDGVNVLFQDDVAGKQMGGEKGSQLTRESGVSSGDIDIRAADFGVPYWTSHHPQVVPEPCTIEPTEAYSQREFWTIDNPRWKQALYAALG
jgi:hypothetical protein